MRTGNRNDPAYDVVIVGARVAGAATAHLLARFGLRVLLVDRCRYGTDTLSTHALMRGGVLQLSRWGLLDKIIARRSSATAMAPRTIASTARGASVSRLSDHQVRGQRRPRQWSLRPGRGCPGRPMSGRPGHRDQARSNRSRFMTLSHAATKSRTNFSFASSPA